MFNVDHMRTVKLKTTKPFVFAKKDGHLFHRMYRKDALISTNATAHTDHLECAAQMQFAKTQTEDLNVRVRKGSLAMLISSASMLTSALKAKELVEKMLCALTNQAVTDANVLMI
jgi:hypothetical protein